MQKRDRAAVGMADENRTLDPGSFEHLGDHRRLLLQVVEQPWQGDRVGATGRGSTRTSQGLSPARAVPGSPSTARRNPALRAAAPASAHRSLRTAQRRADTRAAPHLQELGGISPGRERGRRQERVMPSPASMMRPIAHSRIARKSLNAVPSAQNLPRDAVLLNRGRRQIELDAVDGQKSDVAHPARAAMPWRRDRAGSHRRGVRTRAPCSRPCRSASPAPFARSAISLADDASDHASGSASPALSRCRRRAPARSPCRIRRSSLQAMPARPRHLRPAPAQEGSRRRAAGGGGAERTPSTPAAAGKSGVASPGAGGTLPAGTAAGTASNVAIAP